MKKVTRKEILKAAERKYGDLHSMNDIMTANIGDEVPRFGVVIGFIEETAQYIFDSGKKIGVLRVSNQLKIKGHEQF